LSTGRLPENRGFVEDGQENFIQLQGRGLIVPEGFFDYDARIARAVRFRDIFDDGFKQDWRNGKVIRRTMRVLELPA